MQTRELARPLPAQNGMFSFYLRSLYQHGSSRMSLIAIFVAHAHLHSPVGARPIFLGPHSYPTSPVTLWRCHPSLLAAAPIPPSRTLPHFVRALALTHTRLPGSTSDQCRHDFTLSVFPGSIFGKSGHLSHITAIYSLIDLLLASVHCRAASTQSFIISLLLVGACPLHSTNVFLRSTFPF